MRIVDDLVCDPVEFCPDRTELNLSEQGLTVDSVNWGEAAIDAVMVARDMGEEPVDRKPLNKEATLTLKVRSDGVVDLPTAADQLQKKVGLWQREGGWLRRDFYFAEGGDFAGSVACQVKRASLSNFAGWQAGESPDVQLTLLLGPYWYSADELESAVVEETSARELQFTLEDLEGSAPGLIRIRVDNDNASGDWRAAVAAIESRDHPQDATKDTTAALAYDAVKLTLQGGAVEAEREGAKVVRHQNLGNLWQAILRSEIAGVGHMTHRGVRRVWVRIFDPGEETGLVEFRLEWRVLGSTVWTPNATVPTPLIGGFALIDLGECRPSSPALGADRWEWKLMARTTGAAGADIDVARVYPLPAEQFAVVRVPLAFTSPAEFSLRDAFNQSAGNLTGKVEETGKTYAVLTNSDTTPDFAVGEGLLKRTSTSDTGTLL